MAVKYQPSIYREDAIEQLLYTDLQQVNNWKFLVLENFLGSVAGSTDLIGGAVGGLTSKNNQVNNTKVTTLYIQDIDFPSTATIEYEENETFYPRTLKRPTVVTLKFLENEDGTVWDYLQEWRKSVVQVYPKLDSNSLGGFLSSAGGALASGFGQQIGDGNVAYMFKDNQIAAKKTGILLMGSGAFEGGKQRYIEALERRIASGRIRSQAQLEKEIQRLQKFKQQQFQSQGRRALANQLRGNPFGGATSNPLSKIGDLGGLGSKSRNSLGGPNRFPRILFYGMKFQSMDTTSVSYSASGNLIWSVNFQVDEIGAPPGGTTTSPI